MEAAHFGEFWAGRPPQNALLGSPEFPDMRPGGGLLHIRGLAVACRPEACVLIPAVQLSAWF